ncbi:MAG: SDR family NAD(P)-dependent oxidoreductase [Lachnospiraceae bacterium]
MKNLTGAFDLTGRTAIVTGAGSGIGRACARLLALAGAKVMLADLHEEKLGDVSEEIRAAGGTCEGHACDVGSEESCRDLVLAAKEQLGHPEILVCSAGVRGGNGDLAAQFDSENLEMTMRVDFGGIFWMTKYVYQEMQEAGRGSIINIASLAALRGSGPFAYTAAKGAVRSIEKPMAKKFGPLGIRVNTIYPGLILTEMNAGLLQNEKAMAYFKADSALGTVGDPMDIAYCALYLASDASRFVTGQDFVIDGGAMC